VKRSIKQTLHPNAYLKNIRNVKCGLRARSKILILLETQGSSASKIAKQTEMSYGVVVYHLRLLRNEGTVERKGSGRFVWLATGLGQKRLG
jgi:transposase